MLSTIASLCVLVFLGIFSSQSFYFSKPVLQKKEIQNGKTVNSVAVHSSQVESTIVKYISVRVTITTPLYHLNVTYIH